MTHPVLRAERVAVVTGAASGIGRAACSRFAALGMKVVLADAAYDALEAAREDMVALSPGGADNVLAQCVDVAGAEAMARLAALARERFGDIGLLMNNAVTRTGGGALAAAENWRKAIDVNLMGVINGVQAFLPGMLEQAAPSMIVNVGSKQGITNPPGNSAYNVTKAAVKAYTETLQHELRNMEGCHVSAHLLVPGWTTTGGRAHRQGAWLPEQVVEYMEAGLARGDFYILCPDDEVTPEMDRARILWAAGDIVENRPALSRWHPDYKDAFDRFKA